MGARGFETDITQNWDIGVITSVLSDRLPDGAVPLAKNSMFYHIGPQAAVFGTRMGCTVQNTSAFADAVVSQHHLHTDTINKHLVVLDNGDLGYVSGGSFSAIDTTLFTETEDQFSWQTFNNYAYVVNGTDAFKTNGTDSFKFGIAQPGSGDWTATATSGGSNLPADTYDVAIAYYNSATDHTGPTSATKSVTTSGGQRIQVVLPSNGTINDAQVDYVKIFLRRTSTSNQLFLVVAGTDVAITGTSGWAPNTTVKIDSSAAQISAFVILAPAVNKNYPPPTGTKLIFAHKQRMFAVVDNNVYYSETGDPESYDTSSNYEPIGENDGEPITSLSVLSDALIIFKRNAIYAIIGDDPSTWSIQLLNKTTGATSHSGVGKIDNRVWFMSLNGPRMWADISTEVVDITTQLIGNLFDEDAIDPDSLDNSVIIIHPVQNYVAWAITPSSDTTNTTIVPFNYKLERWMASEWTLVDVRSCTLVEDTTGRAWPMVGDYDGFLYKIGVGGNDGTPAGTPVSSVLTAATGTTLTNSLATWPSNGLIGRYVYVWSSGVGPASAQRRKITSNTSTVLTVGDAFDTTPSAGNLYAIGGVLFDWYTAFRHGGQPLLRKRIEFVFLEIESSEAGIECNIKVYKDSDSGTPIMSRVIVSGVSDLWDVGEWDDAQWATAGVFLHRLPIRKIGHTWQTRLTNMGTGNQLVVRRLGVQWLTKTKKLGGAHAG